MLLLFYFFFLRFYGGNFKFELEVSGSNHTFSFYWCPALSSGIGHLIVNKISSQPLRGNQYSKEMVYESEVPPRYLTPTPNKNMNLETTCRKCHPVASLYRV